jgi:maleylacetoacetate isomerase
MPKLRLYHYWRSTSSWRVRWAMAHKGIAPELVHVSLLDGESESPAHRARNPLGYVPVLEFLEEKDPARRYLVESLPIIEYLEETSPANPFLPKDPRDRAHVRALAEIVNAGIQPIQNITVQIHVASDSDPDHAAKRKAWAAHWIANGLEAYEKLAAPRAGKFSFGDAPTLADLTLVPQLYGAIRNDASFAHLPTVTRAYESSLRTEACRASEPDRFKPGP